MGSASGLCVRKFLFISMLLAATFAGAGQVYKSVSPDGRIVYSDHPPASGKLEKTLDFANLPVTPLPESVVRYREELQKSGQKRLSEAAKPAESAQLALFTAQWCG